MTTPAPDDGVRAWLQWLRVERRQAHGLWCSLPSSYCTELVASCAPDFVVIDRQHGFFDSRDLLAALQSIGPYQVPALIRVPDRGERSIGAALDAGAGGVIVPMIEDSVGALAAVRSCRYPPQGHRSYGPGRSALVVAGTPDRVNAAVACVALIETAAGVEHAGQICAVPGLDAVMVGAADLALDLGVEIGSRAAALQDAVAAVAAAAADAALPLMIGAPDNRPELGATVVVAATDASVLRVGVRAALERARGDNASR